VDNSRKWYYRYDIGYYYSTLSIFFHVVYATLGAILMDPTALKKVFEVQKKYWRVLG